MCALCSKSHKIKKGLRDHSLVEQSSGLSGICEPCKFQNKRNDTKCFCIECEEELCLDCSNQHKALKMTRNHKLAGFSKIILKYCEPCSYKNKTIEAKLNCQTCVEDMCIECSEQHKADASEIGHILLNISASDEHAPDR